MVLSSGRVKKIRCQVRLLQMELSHLRRKLNAVDAALRKHRAQDASDVAAPVSLFPTVRRTACQPLYDSCARAYLYRVRKLKAMLSTCGSLLLRMLPNLRLPMVLIHQANELAGNLRWLHWFVSGRSSTRQTEPQCWYRLDQPSILNLSPSTGVQEVLQQATVQAAEGEPPAGVPMDVDADEIECSGSTSPPPSFALNAEQPDDEDVFMQDAWELDRNPSATVDSQSSGTAAEKSGSPARTVMTPASCSKSRDSSPFPEPGPQVKSEEDGHNVDVYPPRADEDHSSAKGRTGRGRTKEKAPKSRRHAARSPSPVAGGSKAEIHVHRSASEQEEAPGFVGELAHMEKQFERLVRASENGIPAGRTAAMYIYFSSTK